MSNTEYNTFNRLTTLKYKDILEDGRSFLLFGPRQTGKTTELQSVFKLLPPNRQLHYYFQVPTTLQAFENDPETLLREVEAKAKSGHKTYVFIDEIQKVPAILDVLQYLLDQKKIVLAACGSSTRKLRRLGANWLPGRVELKYFFPLTWQESNLNINSLTPEEFLRQNLLYGSLPGILSEPTYDVRAEKLASYTTLYLEEEIRAEAAVRNLPKFSKFLQLAALESGIAPNLSKIGQQVGVAHTSIREYFQILEDSMLIHKLSAYGRMRDQVLRSPRYYFFDSGVRNAAADLGHGKALLKLDQGRLFEHFIILEWIARRGGARKLSYWRTKAGVEVDLIDETNDKLRAIEIKNTVKLQAEDFKGLDAFAKTYKNSSTFLICNIPRPQKFGPHLALPWQNLNEAME